ncbi:TetR/AcrR family transcriptional regulator [Sedimentibacter sp.]|uniref:TetR/AcrR family transcriptional regulator n=1 Tax=Sedimentibacter sp. TaxID=1960295 RepID=UPI002897CCDC|nr:TetR/AcrR family transcriptional regulator [Sedimentibacter sp.]
MNSRTIQAQKTKDRIHKTSLKLFMSKGIDNVSIQDIAKAANISVGSFYNYYKSKLDVLYQNYKVADKNFIEFVNNGVEGDTIKEKVKNYMLFYIDFVTSEPYDFTKLLYNNSNKLFLKKGRAMQTLLAPIIDEGINNGEITADMNTEEIIEFLFQSMRGLIFHWCLHDGNFDLHERADKYLELIIKPL